jgi:WD40 repeat protein
VSAHLAGPDEVRRFRLEVESVVRLEHPNIVPVHAAGVHEGRPYFVMRYAAGGTLADRLRERAPGPWARDVLRGDVELLAKVARAVHFAHERGVLHRDLKPANVLLDEAGEPMVGDFGLARRVDEAPRVTMTGAALGTPAYMSPEQASGTAVTTATDVYGLGAMLFHQITGRPPFEGAGPVEVLRRVIAEDAPIARELAPWVDRDLSTVCGKCLQRDPAKRYRSAAALADDLDRWLAGEAVTARPIGVLERSWRWARRRPVAAALAGSSVVAGAAFVVLLAAGSLLLRDERNEARRQEAIARGNATEARLAGESLRQHAYAADVYLASRALKDGHLGVARRMLERHEPRVGEADLRGYEWHAFKRQCRGDEVRVWKDHTAAVTAVAFDASGRFVASGGRDGRVVVRALPSGEEVLRLPKADAPKDLAEIPLMTTLSAGSPEIAALLLRGELNPAELRMRGRPSMLGEVLHLSWSPDGSRLVTGGDGGYVRVWSMPEGKLAGLIPVTHAQPVFHSPDGSRLVVVRRDPSGARKHVVRIYRTEDLSLVRVITGVEPCAAISPDGRRLGEVGSADGRHGVLAVSADGRHVAGAGTGQTIALLDAPSLAGRGRLRGSEDGIHALAFSPDGKWLVSGGNDHGTRLWSLDPAAGSADPEPGKRTVPTFGDLRARGPDGVWVGDGKASGSIVLEGREGGKPLRRLAGPPGAYPRLIASPDGKRLAALSWPRDLFVAGLPEGKWQAKWRLSEGTVGPIVFSADGRWLASGGDDNVVTVRDAGSGEVRAVLRGHREQLYALAFSPDGWTLASSSADRTLRLWHLPTWRELGTLHEGDDFRGLEFDAGGGELRATDGEGRIFLFPGRE